MNSRIIRTFWLWLPRWRSQIEAPVNWMLFRWYDFAPLFVGFMAAAFIVPIPPVVPAVLAGWYFVGIPVVLGFRIRRRGRWCRAHGHTPYKPVGEVNEWECAWCGAPLAVTGPNVVATAVAHAASEIDLARRTPQARYSDRR